MLMVTTIAKVTAWQIDRTEGAMLGLMQEWPLTLDRIITHAERWHGSREVVSRLADGAITRTDYATICRRARSLATGLIDQGVQQGDRIGTLAFNSAAHLETWYAIMGVGAVCHTLNPRLHPDQLSYIINHAADKVLLVDRSLLPNVLAIRNRLETVKRIFVLPDSQRDGNDGASDVDACLLSQATPASAWGNFDEQSAAGLCYTSGTTGDPKGVLYSHRSNFILALTVLGADVLGLTQRDVVMPIVPMFHANGWGIPFAAPLAGSKLVLPGSRLDGASVHDLIEREGVTFAAAVPTVWQTLLTYLRDTGRNIPTLKRVVIGGAAPPPDMVRAFEEEFDVSVISAWGMTETSPLGTLSAPIADRAERTLNTAGQRLLKQGRVVPAFDMKLVDEAGAAVPHDGVTNGRLLVNGPFVARRYFGQDIDCLDEASFFDTGDIATIDSDGFMQITDRAKDVIKSGGEWISSVEIENVVASHPDVTIAAVIGVPNEKWGERPLLVASLVPGSTVAALDLLAYLDGKIARWWMPDRVVFMRDIPLGATGKIDKKVLRDRLRNGHVDNEYDRVSATSADSEPTVSK